MPLLHDPTEIADVDAVESVLLSQLGIICMVVGINHITDAREFYRRVNLMERATGAFRTRVKEDQSGIEDVFLTPDEAKSVVGYRTNVTAMTKAKFKTHVQDTHDRLVVGSKDWK